MGLSAFNRAREIRAKAKEEAQKARMEQLEPGNGERGAGTENPGSGESGQSAKGSRRPKAG